jgi:hypothetical protein
MIFAKAVLMELLATVCDMERSSKCVRKKQEEREEKRS